MIFHEFEECCNRLMSEISRVRCIRQGVSLIYKEDPIQCLLAQCYRLRGCVKSQAVRFFASLRSMIREAAI